MGRRKMLAVAVLVLVTSTCIAQETGIPPIPFCEVFFATEGPLSVFCVPDGSGNPLTSAFNQLGQEVDGTLSIILYNDSPDWGDPVPNFPREDIWLYDLHGGLAMCWGGGIPDSDTDSDGRTSWISPMLTGGHMEPVGGNQIVIYVNGWELVYPSLEVLRMNSPDLNGDMVVNLTDVYLFTQGYFGPYDYAYDFRWDGAVNLSDLALLASSLGKGCP